MNYQQVRVNFLRNQTTLGRELTRFLNRHVGLVRYIRIVRSDNPNVNSHAYIRFWVEEMHAIATEFLHQHPFEERYLEPRPTYAQHDDYLVEWPRSLTIYHHYPSMRYIQRILRNVDGEVALEHVQEPEAIRERLRRARLRTPSPPLRRTLTQSTASTSLVRQPQRHHSSPRTHSTTRSRTANEHGQPRRRVVIADRDDQWDQTDARFPFPPPMKSEINFEVSRSTGTATDAQKLDVPASEEQPQTTSSEDNNEPDLDPVQDAPAVTAARFDFTMPATFLQPIDFELLDITGRYEMPALTIDEQATDDMPDLTDATELHTPPRALSPSRPKPSPDQAAPQ